MIFFLLVLAVVFALGARVCVCGFNGDYMSRTETSAIKGFFIGWVFLSHVNSYISKSGYAFAGFGDGLWLSINDGLGQLMVVMFLFYSGYGVMMGAMSKGDSYVKAMPQHRILPTLLNFDVAVLLFVVVDLLTGVRIGVTQTVLSLVGWESVGNSNWYIFVILICYVLTWFGLSIRTRQVYRVVGVILFIGFAMLALSCAKPSWWYDTMMAFPAGVVFAVVKGRAEPLLKKRYWFALLLAILAFAIFSRFPYEFHGVRANSKAVAFAAVVVLLTMKVKIGNPVLVWMGVHLFPIYIYQRIPMQVLYDMMGGGLRPEPLVWLYGQLYARHGGHCVLLSLVGGQA